jgi:ATP-dependent RNA helicase DDX56/DBP9
LERFGIKSSVLNSQLPIASRIHILQDFNAGAIDVLVAVDEGDDSFASEFSAARGVDFHNLRAVVNFDLPPTVEQYIHRVGRTARAMKSGSALSFITNLTNFAAISEYLKDQEGFTPEPLDFNIKDAEIFRYRVNAVLQTITKRQIKESRKIDIKREVLNSEKLKAHFEENPADLKMLRHDSVLLPTRVDRALKVLPDYLGKQLARAQNPLSMKIRDAKLDNPKARKELAKLDSISDAIKRRKKKEEKKHGRR